MKLRNDSPLGALDIDGVGVVEFGEVFDVEDTDTAHNLIRQGWATPADSAAHTAHKTVTSEDEATAVDEAAPESEPADDAPDSNDAQEA